MSNSKKKNQIGYKKLYILIILIILITILIGNLNSRLTEDELLSPQSEEEVEEYIEQNITKTLQGMEERDRMEYYIGIFLGYIESGEYEDAYHLLYEDFKKTYFPTLESFEKYIPTVFSEMTDIKHENIERNGDVYVLWIKITDAVNGKPGEQRNMNIVIKENDYNDFVLSFSVI